MPTSITELEEKIASLNKRYSSVLKRKAELGGALNNKKEELTELIREISDAGYSPKTLVEDRDKAQAELESLISTFETDLTQAETALAAYDKKLGEQMKFKMKTADLTNAISLASIVAPRQVNAQSGSGYLFVVKGETCSVYSRDVTSVAKAEFPVTDVTEEGSFVYPAQYVDAFAHVGETITFEAKALEDDKFLVRYEDDMGRDMERMSFDPVLLSTCDRDLEQSTDPQEFPVGMLREAISLARPFLASTKDTRTEEQYKGLVVFDPTKDDSKKGNGNLFAGNSIQAFYFQTEAFQDKSLEIHGLYLAPLVAFLSKSEGNVTIRKGQSFTFACNSKGQVYGWPRQSKTHTKYAYYALKNDTYVFKVPKAVINNELKLTRKSLDSTRDKIKLTYNAAQKTLRFDVADSSSKAKTFAFPVEVEQAEDKDQVWSVNIDHLMTLIDGVKGNEVTLRVAIVKVKDQKDVALFRTIDAFRMTPEGKVVIEPEGSFPCQVTRFMPSKD